jgi:surface protein
MGNMLPNAFKRTKKKAILGSITIILCLGLLTYTNCGQKSGTSGDAIVQAGAPFVSIWETTTPNESITLPLREGFEYNMIVDWGDGSPKEKITSWDDSKKTHEYAEPGQHTITLKGLAEALYFNNNGFSTCTDTNSGNAQKIISVTDLGDMGWKNLERAFCGCNNLQSLSGGVTSNVTNMSRMFHGAFVSELDVSKWDTSKVTNMSGMFDGMGAQLDVSKWNTSSVTDMSFMFSNSSSNPDLSRWDTSQVTTMASMFIASNFTADISGWNTRKVTTMNQMFYLSVFNPDMSDWDFTNITNMASMLVGSQITNENYTALLKQIHATRTVNGVFLSTTNQYYNSAAAARASLISDYGWSISDNGSGGPDPG